MNRKVLMLLMNDDTMKVIEINEESLSFEFNNFKDTVLDFGSIITIKFDDSYRNLILFNSDN